MPLSNIIFVYPHLALLDEGYGGDERLYGRGVLPGGRVAHSPGDGARGNGPVPAHHFLELRLADGSVGDVRR